MTAGRIARWIGIVLAALALLIGALLLAIDTGPGHRFVADRIGGYETASGMVVKVGRIEGSIYGRMTLTDVRVSDPSGVFASAPALTVDWRPFAYLHSKIDLRELSADTITLDRLPAFKPTPTDPNAPLLPDIDLTLGKLAIRRFVIEPPVTGQRHIVSLAGSAGIADRTAKLDLDAAALAAPGVRGGDRLVLKLDASPDRNRLTIDGRLTAPAGGLVDSYAHLDRPLAVTIGGKGDWAHWTGRLDGDTGGRSLAGLAIDARDGTFHIAGNAAPGVILTGPAARLTEPAIALDATAVLGQRKLDLTLDARSAAFAAQAKGLLDLGASRFGGFRVAAQLLKPGAIADNVRGRDVKLTATLDGAFARPVIAYDLAAAQIGFGTTGIDGLAAHGEARIDANRILVPLHATARAVTGLNAAAGGLLTNVRIDGDLAYKNGRVLSDNLKIRSDHIDATAIIVADIGKGTYTGALKGRVNDYQVDGLGRLNLVTDAKLVTAPGGGFGIVGRVRVETRRLDNASVASALGGNAIVTADVGYDQNGVASVRNLRMSAPRFRITGGEGTYRTSGAIAFRAQGVSADYGPVSVIVTGTATAPQVRLVAQRPGFGVGLANVRAEVIGTGAGYQVRASGDSQYGPFVADLLVRTGRGPLAIDIRRATFAGFNLAGSIVQTAAGPYAGTLTVSGQGVNGSAKLGGVGRVQRADFDLTANGARVPGPAPITIGYGRVVGSAILYPGKPQIVARAALADVAQGSFVLAKAQARIDYAGGRGTAALAANGRSGVPFDIQAQAALSPSLIRVNAKGAANGIAFRLAQPATIAKAGADWRLAPATIVLPQGQVDLAGSYGADTRFDARLRSLDLAILEAFVPGLGLGGKASGTIDLAYPKGATVPTTRSRLDIAGFTRTSALVVSRPVDIATLSTLSAAGADMRAIIRSGATVIGRAQLKLAPLGAGAGLVEKLQNAALSGGIRYAGPAEVLWTLTGIGGQTLNGPVAVGADFGGRLASPNLTGVIRADALRYENQAYGTVLSSMAVDGRFTQSQLVLNSLTAKAGRGNVSASGTIGLDADGGFPIDLKATLDNAQLARSDAIDARVSGTVAVTNSKAAGALIKGDLRIPEARYEIIRQGAAEVPELTGVRRKGAPLPTQATGGGAPSNWKLDLRVRAPNQIFVTGMGLEAEWATDLRVTGTATDPRVVGKLEVVRGTYSFSGRRFELADTSAVTFDGGAMTNPLLNLSASTTVEGVSAIINIGGRALAPQIVFTSTPALPQDEVLSRLLFGTSVTSLSPTQAIQLAAALNGLRGSGGGGLNPLGKLRSATGISRLRVLGADKTAGRGTALAAGQYISNNIYVEIITDARGFTATQLEISLSKALSILSATSSFGGSSVNLRYSKDY